MLAASLLAARKGMTSYAGCQLTGSQESDDIMLATICTFFYFEFLVGVFCQSKCFLQLGIRLLTGKRSLPARKVEPT